MGNVTGSRPTTGDAVTITEEATISLTADDDTELIMVDVPTAYDPVGIWARRISTQGWGAPY